MCQCRNPLQLRPRAGEAGGQLVQLRDDAALFGEDQGRYLLAVADGAVLVEAARRAGIEGRLLGRSGGDGLTLPTGATISLARLNQAHRAFFPALMGG